MLAITYLLELAVTYIAVFHMTDIMKQKNIGKKGGIVLCLLVVVDIVRFITVEGILTSSPWGTFLVSGLIVMVICSGVTKDLISKVIMVVIGAGFFGMSIIGIMMYFTTIALPTLLETPLYRQLIMFAVLLLFLGIAYFMKRKELKLQVTVLGTKEVVLVMITIICLGFYISSLQRLGMGQRRILTLVAGLGGFFITGIIVWLIAHRKKLQYAKFIQEIQEKVVVLFYISDKTT